MKFKKSLGRKKKSLHKKIRKKGESLFMGKICQMKFYVDNQVWAYSTALNTVNYTLSPTSALSYQIPITQTSTAASFLSNGLSTDPKFLKFSTQYSFFRILGVSLNFKKLLFSGSNTANPGIIFSSLPPMSVNVGTLCNGQSLGEGWDADGNVRLDIMETAPTVGKYYATDHVYMATDGHCQFGKQWLTLKNFANISGGLNDGQLFINLGCPQNSFSAVVAGAGTIVPIANITSTFYVQFCCPQNYVTL